MQLLLAKEDNVMKKYIAPEAFIAVIRPEQTIAKSLISLGDNEFWDEDEENEA